MGGWEGRLKVWGIDSGCACKLVAREYMFLQWSVSRNKMWCREAHLPSQQYQNNKKLRQGKKENEKNFVGMKGKKANKLSLTGIRYRVPSRSEQHWCTTTLAFEFFDFFLSIPTVFFFCICYHSWYASDSIFSPLDIFFALFSLFISSPRLLFQIRLSCWLTILTVI